MAGFCSISGCGTPLPDGAKKYCTKRCSRKAEQEKRKLKREARGAVRIGTPRPCAGCSASFVATGPAAKWCSDCRTQAGRDKTARYRAKNPDLVADQDRTSDKKRSSKPERKLWNRNYQRSYTAKRRQDPRHRLDHRMGQLVRNGLAGAKDGRAWASIVGYTLDELVVHLEKQFLPGMTWHNVGAWHVDHILPRAMFSYASETDPDFKACWALTNLRPLWSEENASKGAKRLFLI